ncbi:MAG: hypothetical protein EPO23_03170 [Xanthobacteraceae bacterium]|nr:MAG: hypothetical protein EPO23_03170 [Xanthobacteraceae bacterium]
MSDLAILMPVASALALLWTMQCVTFRAGTADRRKIMMLLFRLALGGIAGGQLYYAYAAARAERVLALDEILMLATVLVFAVILPFALGGRRGGVRLSGTVRRRHK